jgi:hypothetical protein
MFNFSLIVGAVIIVIGFAVATIGWKIHRAMIALSGFVIGALSCNLIIASLSLIDDLTWIWGLSITAGILSAILFIIYEKKSIGVTSGIIGAAIISDLTSTHILVGWDYGYPILETRLNYIPILLAFLISTYAGLRFYKIGYIILSTGIGAILVAWGGIVSGIWVVSRVGFPILLSLLLGIIIQLAQEGSRRELIIREREMLYCSKCNRTLPKEYKVCPDCGTLLLSHQQK